MRTRVNYLEKLISHLNVLKVDLDQRTRWMLLWNAEKMTVATLIWKQHEKFLAERLDGDKKTIVSETAVYINEQQKTEPNPAIGEVDPVRHWFIHDVWRLDIFIAWGYQIIKYAYTERLTDTEGLNRLLYEAVTVANLSLREARRYRHKQSGVYGVQPWTASAAIPEPWNATHPINNNLKRLVEFCHTWLDQYYLGNPDVPLDSVLLDSVCQQLPSLTNEYLNCLQEYAKWADLSGDETTKGYGKLCKDAYRSDYYEKILKLKDYELWAEAVELAEQHESFDAMARLLVEHLVLARQQASTRALPTNKANEQVAAIEKLIGDNFDKYGREFAFPAYEVLLDLQGIQDVLEFHCDRQGFATQFLRTKPELAKISWINDVEREKDIDHAAETLLDLGLTREQQVWNKKIELSLGKLALMAEEAEELVAGDNASNSLSDSEAKSAANLDKINRELDLIKVQDSLYNEILPSITTAVDESVEVQLALEAHGGLILKKQKVLGDIFEDAMFRLLKHEALDALSLIDLLTLSRLRREHVDEIGDQFYLALHVAALSLKGEDRKNAERLIWRRCYLRDDWNQINETNNKADIDQLEAVAATAAYSAMFAIADRRKSICTKISDIRDEVAHNVFR